MWKLHLFVIIAICLTYFIHVDCNDSDKLLATNDSFEDVSNESAIDRPLNSPLTKITPQENRKADDEDEIQREKKSPHFRVRDLDVVNCCVYICAYVNTNSVSIYFYIFAYRRCVLFFCIIDALRSK